MPSSLTPLAWIAVAAAAAGSGYALAVLAGRAPVPPRRVRRWLVPLVALPVAVLILRTGGLASPALVLAALAVPAYGVGSAREAATAAAGILAAVGAAHLRWLGPVEPQAGVTAVLLVVAVALAPALLVRWAAREAAADRQHASRISRMVGRASRRSSGGGRRTSADPALPALPSGESGSGRAPRLLVRQLRDLADDLGARDAVYLRIALGRSPAAVAWASPGGEEPAWVGESRLLAAVDLAASGGAPVSRGLGEGGLTAVAAPVGAARDARGVVAVIADAGSGLPADETERRLVEHAGELERTLRLLDAPAEAARTSQALDELLRGASELQTNRRLPTLGPSLCARALAVARGSHAALVRWNADGDFGVVEAVSPGHPLAENAPVSAASHVGAACLEGETRLWEDGRELDRALPLFAVGEEPRPVGALAVVPLRLGLRVLGALVVEADQPRGLRPAGVRGVELLASLAAASLETIWDIDRVVRGARTDRVTGLANRRSFQEYASRVLAESERYGGSTSVILADVDGLRQAADALGWAGGDEVLRAVAATVIDCVRGVDFCARVGADEIAILSPRTPLDGAVVIAERLRRAIEATPVGRGSPVRVTASFGVAAFPECSRSRDEIFEVAARALMRAKAQGRNRVVAAPAEAEVTPAGSDELA